MKTRTATLTLKLVGPMKRSTFDPAVPDPIDESIGDLLHWCWATRRQLDRFVASIHKEFEHWGSSRRLKSRRGVAATSFDEHLVYIAAGNLHRALERMPRPVRRAISVPTVPGRALRLLRDVYEHWDQLRRQYRTAGGQAGAAERLQDEFPGAEPWTFTFNPQTDEVILANVIHVTPLIADLRTLEARVLRFQRTRARQA